MNNLPPILQQTLDVISGDMLARARKTEAELVAADKAVQAHKDSYHARNDAQALRLQLNRPQTVEGWVV